MLPTAAAFEHADRVGQRAVVYFESLGARAKVLDVLHRGEAEDPQDRRARAQGEVRVPRRRLSAAPPLGPEGPARCSSRCSRCTTVAAWWRRRARERRSSAIPMVDPRGGAYTVGLGAVRNLAVFPYHGTAAEHLRARSIDLLPASATLVGIDEQTALWLRGGTWKVAGAGQVSVYDRDGEAVSYGAGARDRGPADVAPSLRRSGRRGRWRWWSSRALRSTVIVTLR